ncbi:sulfatase [Pontiella sulfatireligans]|uniref:Arylsulfatase n=1 Tax=Pontiella sulfatireligans TaxID=2750658 RepID=A0A6C2UN88_9BACT|nr:sulfatase [Pontiella sulfatireligans]SPS74465.1 sulfatase S1_7 [Kiritimatiellales bacterium]VGO21732.1 Arylsulfatase [Pontiella sulfatireligans]
MKKLTYLVVVLLLACSCQSKQKPNILFLAVDDLRPELGCYGSPIAVTPNMDKLAADGLLFNRAFCQEAICGPSRASLMAGARPDTIRVTENFASFRPLNPDMVTLSQNFIANGYEAVYCGKIFHNKPESDPEFSWSRDPVSKASLKLKVPATVGGFALPENQAILKENKAYMSKKYPGMSRLGLGGKGPAYECADVPDATYEDGLNTELAIATMKDMLKKNPDKPFFLGLGLKKPHLDWIAPKPYWDLYDPVKIPLATQTEGPKDGAEMGLHASFELRVRTGIPKSGGIDDEMARTLKHAYLACVSYADANLGKMIDALDEAGIRDNTIIIVWGDHGWHLGDMGIWGKATNYEVGTRVPMMIWTPDMPKGSRGKTTDGLVELIDMYPTLCDLAGIPVPSHVEGTSFKPLLANPDREWKAAAFSQFPDPALREWAANPLSPGLRETFFGPLIEEVEARIIKQQGAKWDRDLFENNLMGYTMRTDRYRLVVWKDVVHPDAEPVFVELYDHKEDPQETVNVAAKTPELVASLLIQFSKGWKGNLPK